MIVVSNTSPVINLVAVNQLNLLQKLYGKVVIPQAVYDEIVIEGTGQKKLRSQIGLKSGKLPIVHWSSH